MVDAADQSAVASVSSSRSVQRKTSGVLCSLPQVAGTDLDHVLKLNVFLRRMEDLAVFEEVYKAFFRGVLPPRRIVACTLGHPATEGRPGMGIEPEAVAGVPTPGE